MGICVDTGLCSVNASAHERPLFISIDFSVPLQSTCYGMFTLHRSGNLSGTGNGIENNGLLYITQNCSLHRSWNETRPIVSYCASPIPCTCTIPVTMQCECAITMVRPERVFYHDGLVGLWGREGLFVLRVRLGRGWTRWCKVTWHGRSRWNLI